jgi:DNA-binding response OmpR family regulator
MSEKILIVDDDRNICEILEFNLKNEGYEVDTAFSAEEALRSMSENTGLILLDVMMGGMSGFKMAEKLRQDGVTVPIIFITAKDTENEMLTGFSVGADDYISKPFSIKELIARVKAVLKRVGKTAVSRQDGRLQFNHFVLDTERKELIMNGEHVNLTKTEFTLLELLALHPGRIFSRGEIIGNVWSETPFITERTVDVHITRLKKKMGEYASTITNRSGFGYGFNDFEI